MSRIRCPKKRNSPERLEVGWGTRNQKTSNKKSASQCLFVKLYGNDHGIESSCLKQQNIQRNACPLSLRKWPWQHKLEWKARSTCITMLGHKSDWNEILNSNRAYNISAPTGGCQKDRCYLNPKSYSHRKCKHLFTKLHGLGWSIMC